MVEVVVANVVDVVVASGVVVVAPMVVAAAPPPQADKPIASSTPIDRVDIRSEYQSKIDGSSDP
jgi:hypothetical protein